MSGQESSDDETELAIELRAGPSGRGNTKAAGRSSSSYLKTVVHQQQDTLRTLGHTSSRTHQQQDTTKTCRLLALEVGSLKAELTREQKKRAQAISRATKAEAAHQHAEQRLHELQYSNSKLQQELTAAKDAAESSSRRVHSLRQSLADAEAEVQEKLTLGQQQVRDVCQHRDHCCAGYRSYDSYLPAALAGVYAAYLACSCCLSCSYGTSLVSYEQQIHQPKQQAQISLYVDSPETPICMQERCTMCTHRASCCLRLRTECAKTGSVPHQRSAGDVLLPPRLLC